MVPTFSVLPGSPDDVDGGSCPGATPWCAKACYAKKGRQRFPTVRQRYKDNLERLLAPGGYDRFVREITQELRQLGAGICRIHVAGDFFSKEYVFAWARVIRANPHIRFWTYTRSWQVPALGGVLEDLRTLPNLQLFASVDKTTKQTPPAGWRIAYVSDGTEQPGLACPEQTGAQPNCAACGFCFNKPRRRTAKLTNVVFKVH